MATPCVKLLGHQCFTMLCVFLSFCNSLDQPSIWNFTVIEVRIRCITKEHISMHGIDPTCGCIHSIIDTMLFSFSRLFRQVYVQIKSLCMDSFWFLWVTLFVNCGQKISVQRLLPRRRFQQFGSSRSSRLLSLQCWSTTISREFWPIEKSGFEKVRCHFDHV